MTTIPALIFAGLATAGTKDGEQAFLTDLKKAIPRDRIASVEDLHSIRQDIETRPGKAS